MTEAASNRTLLFLNEVAGGRKLVTAVRERAESGDHEFLAFAPQNQPRVGYAVERSEVRAAAQSRVDVTRAILREFGIEARGMVGDPAPQLALDDAVRNFLPTEILISCRPETRFGLMRRDLVSWAKGRYDVPVEHISVRIEDDSISWDVTHTLVVASQTVASGDLIRTLKQRSREQEHRYTIVCPLGDADEEARRSLCDRLAHTLAELYRTDISATGQPTVADPFDAVANAIAYYSVDEVLISTFPGEQSRWLQENLVERVKELTDKPVAHVVAGQGSEERAAPVAAGTA